MSAPRGRFGGLSMIVRRSLRQHALSTFITVASLALGSGLVMAVFVVNAQTQAAFVGGPIGFDAVLGARGSQLQLVLNTVFHLETSPGNIPWKHYQAVKADRRVKLAIPYAVGDNYRNHRIVGTTTEIFTEFEFDEGRRYELTAGSRVFDPEAQEAVIGSTVAQMTGLQVGSHFHPSHGFISSEHMDHDHEAEYVIVGVMKPTNTPADRVIWIPIDGVFLMDGHELRGSGEVYVPKPGERVPDEHKEVSAVMLQLHSPMHGMQLKQRFNKEGVDTTLAWPIPAALESFFTKMGWVREILEVVAYLVVVVGAGSILASIYNTMNERRREFAILRSLGARRRTVFSIILMESTTIAVLGCAVGYLVYAAILSYAAVIVRQQTGVVIDVTAFHAILAWTPLGMAVIGFVAGILPAMKAYSTDVISNL